MNQRLGIAQENAKSPNVSDRTDLGEPGHLGHTPRVRTKPAFAIVWLSLVVPACAAPPSGLGDGSSDLGRRDAARPDLPPPDSDLAHDTALPDQPAGDLVPVVGNCWSTAPPGAPLAAPLPAFSGGTCPTLVAGSNTILSQGAQRTFVIVLPSSPLPGESYPVLFLWYWLKGSASDFISKGEVQAAVDQQRFIAVVPEAKGDLDLLGFPLPWPFTTFTAQARLQEELVFFDDMLACVGQQYPINRECVSTVGVSAGALFGSQLAAARSQHLASFISLSGGIGGGGGVNAFIRSWSTPPARKLPAMVLWGGPADTCITLNFQVASQALEQQLIAGGHFFVECVHNCKHGEPPLDPAPGTSKYAAIWDFAFNHPFWLPAGQSPFLAGLPSGFIAWCGVGQGSAVPRTGTCPPPGCPF